MIISKKKLKTLLENEREKTDGEQQIDLNHRFHRLNVRCENLRDDIQELKNTVNKLCDCYQDYEHTIKILCEKSEIKVESNEKEVF